MTEQHRRKKREKEVERIKGRDAREESAAKITDMFTSMAALSRSQLIHCFLSVHSCICTVLAAPACSQHVCANISNGTVQGKVSKLSLDFIYNLSRRSEVQPVWSSSRCLLFSSCPVTWRWCLNGRPKPLKILHVSKVTVHPNFLNVNRRVRHLGENTSYNIQGSVYR